MAEYKRILHSIEEIWDRTTEAEENKIVRARWLIGAEIVRADHQGSRAMYGEEVIQKLSADLTERFGSGFSERNLRLMRGFHGKYSISKLKRPLTWTHYCQLLEIRDDVKRKQLEAKALRLNWSVSILQREVRAVRQNRRPVELERPDGELFIFRLGLGSFATRLDCGFSIGAKIPGIERFKPGSIVRAVPARGGYGFEAVDDLAEPPYIYQCRLDRVIDGDTISAYIDMGFGLTVKQKVRLSYIDTPELPTAQGRKAKKFVEDKLRGCRKLILETHKSDKWDRYLASVLYKRGVTNATQILKKGKFLNQELLDRGKAIYSAR